ncbi:MAG TPA: NAD(P)-dependent oxidoreductase [Gemmatimonadales bacterium]|nr:NAD(P)-dependent oxidoreductase [Gemmatimonadales bacterium]
MERVMKPRVAVLGTGIMGAGMAARLLDEGFAVDVWDRTPAATAPLAERGATAHGEAAPAVRDADVVITMLATGDAVSKVMIEGGTLAAIRQDGVWAQMGTIGLEATDSLIAEVARRRPEVAFVDAPVSGTRDPARNGQLTILASGPERARGALESVFAALGQRVLWLGAAGQGMRMKLVLNTWLAFEVEAAAEASALAHRLGVPYAAVLEAVKGGPLASGTALARLAKMESADHSPQFPLEWALKDLDLVSAASGAGPVPVAEAIAERWRGLVRDGYGRLDVSAARMELDGDRRETHR